MLACGHEPSAHADCFTGTGKNIHGVEVCWNCCNKAELFAFGMADRYCAYLSGDGKSITSWPGGILAEVTQERTIGHNMSRHGITYVRARDVLSGQEWYGRGSGRGVCITIHRVKGRI